MKSKKIIIVMIIIVLAALCTLFITKKMFLSKSTKDTEKVEKTKVKNKQITAKKYEEIYQDFIESKEYLNNASSEADLTADNIKYAYQDLDNDNINELILYTTDDGNFGTDYFYTIDKTNYKKVKFISRIYHYSNITYNTDYSTIVYTEVRPSMAYGYAYGFYKLNIDKFELVKTVGVNIENGQNTYYIDDKTITEEEYNDNFKNNISFNYQEVK